MHASALVPNDSECKTQTKKMCMDVTSAHTAAECPLHPQVKTPQYVETYSSLSQCLCMSTVHCPLPPLACHSTNIKTYDKGQRSEARTCGQRGDPQAQTRVHNNIGTQPYEEGSAQHTTLSTAHISYVVNSRARGNQLVQQSKHARVPAVVHAEKCAGAAEQSSLQLEAASFTPGSQHTAGVALPPHKHISCFMQKSRENSVM